MGLVRMRVRVADSFADPSVVLEPVTGGPRLAVPVTAAEARELAAATIEHGECGPACTAVLAPVRRLEAAVLRATVDAEDDQLQGRLTLDSRDGEFAVRCVPADAIRLAVRGRAPIYATRSALALARRGAD